MRPHRQGPLPLRRGRQVLPLADHRRRARRPRLALPPAGVAQAHQVPMRRAARPRARDRPRSRPRRPARPRSRARPCSTSRTRASAPRWHRRQPGDVYRGRTDVVVSDSDSCGHDRRARGQLRSEVRRRRAACRSGSTFTSAQAEVSLFARVPAGPGTPDGHADRVRRQRRRRRQPTVPTPTGRGARSSCATPDGAARSRSVEIGTTPRFRARHRRRRLLAVAAAGRRHHGRAVGDGRLGRRDVLVRRQPGPDDVQLPARRRGGRAVRRRRSPTPGWPTAQHTFQVTGTDRWGTADATPGRADVDGPARGRPRRGRRGRRHRQLPGQRERGPGRRGPGRGRRRLRGAALGQHAGRGGQVATVKLLSGEVFVKLPAGASGSAMVASPWGQLDVLAHEVRRVEHPGRSPEVLRQREARTARRQSSRPRSRCARDRRPARCAARPVPSSTPPACRAAPFSHSRSAVAVSSASIGCERRPAFPHAVAGGPARWQRRSSVCGAWFISTPPPSPSHVPRQPAVPCSCSGDRADR